jgi:hypothetical protein
MRLFTCFAVSAFFALTHYCRAWLIISEVFVDGTDEYIELYNDGGEFSGSLVFEGLKSSTLKLQDLYIPNQWFYLVGDNGSMFQGISLQKSWLSLSLIDTAWVSITMKDWSWTMLDTFLIDQTIVTYSDNKKTSFQKILIDAIWTITGSLMSQNYNAIPGYIINPGKISLSVPPTPSSTWSSATGNQSWTSTWTNTSWTGNESIGNTWNQQQTWEIYTWSQAPESNEIATGNVSTGENVTTGQQGVPSLPQETPTAPTHRIYISEIHPGNDNYFKEYIELSFETAYSGSLRIVGAGHGSAEKTIIVSQPLKSKLLLWWEDFWFGNYLLDGLSLTDWWEKLTLLWQDGLVLDMVVYNWHVAKKSMYRWGIGEGGVYIFDKVDVMTPGYTKEQVAHLLPSGSWYILPCGIDFQNRTPRYAGTSMNVAGLWNKEIISNSSTQHQCSRKVWNTLISSQCNPGYISITGAVLDTMTLEVLYGGESCIHTIPLNIPDKVGTSSSSSAWSSSYYAEYQLWKDKFYDLLRTVRLLGFDLSTSKLMSMDERVLSSSILLTGSQELFSGSLSIEEVLPNPKGKDTAESIRISFSGTGIISGVYLSYENKVFPLTAIDLSQQQAIYTTGFAFPNDGSCIELKFWTKIFDTLCYSKTKEGVWYTKTWGVGEGDIILSGTSLQSFDLRKTKKEVCAYLDGKKILCEPLWETSVKEKKSSTKEQKSFNVALKKLEKQLVKKDKELVKLQKKLEKQGLKIVKLTEKQQKLLGTTKELRKKYTERRKKKDITLVATRGKNTNLTELVRLHTKYIGFLEHIMYEEREGVTSFAFDSFVKTRVMHGILETSLKQGNKKEFVISPYIYGKSDMLLGLAHGEVSAESLGVLYPPLYKDLIKDMQVIQENIGKGEKQQELVKLGKR